MPNVCIPRRCSTEPTRVYWSGGRCTGSRLGSPAQTVRGLEEKQKEGGFIVCRRAPSSLSEKQLIESDMKRPAGGQRWHPRGTGSREKIMRISNSPRSIIEGSECKETRFNFFFWWWWSSGRRGIIKTVPPLYSPRGGAAPSYPNVSQLNGKRCSECNSEQRGRRAQRRPIGSPVSGRTSQQGPKQALFVLCDYRLDGSTLGSSAVTTSVTFRFTHSSVCSIPCVCVCV